MSGGYVRLFRWKGIPIRLHWLVIALFAYALFVGRFLPTQLIAYGLILLVHELGHAVLVRRYRLRVLAIQIHPFGGECIHEATSSPREQVVIAWGGVLGQAVLFALALIVDSFLLTRAPLELRQFLATLLVPNLLVAAFNLLPIAPLDGHRAWRLRHLLRPRAAPSSKARKPAPRSPAARAPQPRPKVVSLADRRRIDAVVDEALDHAKSPKRQSSDEDTSN